MSNDQRSAGSAGSASPTGAGKRLLFIDDDITSLDLISFLFEEKGYEVVRCSSGEEALERINDGEYSFILVDLLMPEINGVETVKKIREKGFSDIPIVAFTAVGDEAMHDEALAAGCLEVITKPCPVERFSKVISTYIG